MKVKIKRKASNGFSVEGNQYKQISDSFGILGGKKHEQGGTDVSLGNKTVEGQRGEPISKDADGGITFYGKMKNPLTGKTFEADAKMLAKKENKAQTFIDKGSILLNTTNPMDKWGILKFNSGKAMLEGGQRKKEEIQQSKEHLGVIQKAMLDTAEENNLDPQKFSNGKAKYGAKVAKNGYKMYRDGGDEDNSKGDAILSLKMKIKKAEGAKSYTDKSGVTGSSAYGMYQFLKGTRDDYYKKNKTYFEKEYGLKNINDFENAFTNNSKNIQEDVMNIHIGQLYDKYKGNEAYILAAHRLGEGAADKLIKNGKVTINTASGGKREIDWNTSIMASLANEKETLNDYIKRGGSSTNDNVPQNGQNSPNQPSITQDSPQPYTPYKVEGRAPNEPTKATRWQDVITNDNYNVTDSANTPSFSNAKKMGIGQIIPELVGFAGNRQEFVPLQQFQPKLYQPYQMDFQERRNQNAQTFNALQGTLGDNPEALSYLASQKYEADNQVNADEFRTNQSISNDVTNKNIGLINDAQLKNLSLADTQYVRQSQAKSNTKAINHDIMNSISSKVLQNEAENNALKVYENLYEHYRFDPLTGKAIKVGAPGQDYLGWNTNTQSSTPDGANDRKVTLDANNNVTKTVINYPSADKSYYNKLKTEDLKYSNLQKQLNRISLFGKKPNVYNPE